jgi:hypothetical protein
VIVSFDNPAEGLTLVVATHNLTGRRRVTETAANDGKLVTEEPRKARRERSESENQALPLSEESLLKTDIASP